MTIQIPGVDEKKGLDLYDDDEDLYLIILRSYADNTPAVLNKLRTVSAETLKDYAAAMHGIKGTSTAVGAEELRQAALKLETMARDGDISGVQAGNPAFLKQADTLIEDIKAWLGNNQ